MLSLSLEDNVISLIQVDAVISVNNDTLSPNGMQACAIAIVSVIEQGW